MLVYAKLPFKGTNMPDMSIINLILNIPKKDMVLTNLSLFVLCSYWDIVVK